MAASKWHRLTNIDDDDLAGITGTNSHVFRECNITLNGGTSVETEKFDWSCKTDFTVIVNSGSKNINNAYVGDADQKITIEGSIDGTNFVELDQVTDKDIDAKPYAHIYDFDSKGVMPIMRVALIGTGAGTETIKIAVIPHD